MMKKLIAILFMLGVVLTVVFASPLQSFAAEDGGTVLIMKGKENVETQEIEIDVTVEENTGVCAMLLSLAYDTSVFTLTGLEYGPAFSALSPVHTNTETSDGYGVYPFKFSYLGEGNDTSTGHMMTLRFRVKDNVPDGNYTITLTHERDKDVTYLENNEILTKNLLIDGARITLSDNKVVHIDTVANSNEQSMGHANFYGWWLPVTVGALVLIAGCSILIPLCVKRNKNKKWKKI